MPTVDGMIAGRIDGEDGAVVSTTCDDAAKVVALTGSSRPANTRALLLGRTAARSGSPIEATRRAG